MSVLILNSQGSRYTTLKRARKFVANGHAEWINEHTIRFLSDAECKQRDREHRRQAWLASLDSKDLNADRAIHAKRATYLQIKGVPVTKPSDLMAPSPRRHFASDHAVWKAKQGRTRQEREYLDKLDQARRERR